MELTVHGKQMDVGDALRTHVTDKLEDINQKYFNHATFATVTFSREGHGHPKTKAHISIQIGKNIMVVADAVETDPYVSFEAAADKVGKQLRRYKRKLRDHHERLEQTPETEMIKARNYVLSTQSNDGPVIGEDGVPQGDDPVVIAEMSTNIETLTVSEAVMRLDLSDQPALMFRNASHNGVSMVYHRPDGNIGWLDPENAMNGKNGANGKKK
jgi:ribosomal subunit interface protein